MEPHDAPSPEANPPAALARKTFDWKVVLVAALTLAGAIASFRILPAALPQIALGPLATRAEVLERARDFVEAHALADSTARSAVRFVASDSLRTFVELAGGGKDTLDALVRERDVAVFAWLVRFFEPRNPRQTVVQLSADGRVIGFRRQLADSDARPILAADSARAVAERAVVQWTGRDLGRYRLQASSYETRSPSGRVDHSFTYERTDRTIAGAPLRLEVVVAGDLPARVREYVVIPESFTRRYGEMRSSNDFLALIAGIGLIVFVLVAMWALATYSRTGSLRWRPALVVGGVVGTLITAAALNDVPGAWFDYDTATAPTSFLAQNIAFAIAGGVAMTLFVALTLAAAEALTRHAFPEHLDWWRLWRYRATRQVAGRVFGGYSLAVLGFLYIGLFYFAARRWFGWWVPSEVLDDPNQIATPLPWVAGVAVALQAGVWEEALFRAVPLAALALWVGDRPQRRLVLAAGVVLTSLAFGFGHANYPSWPPYSRGVELFLEAALWAVVFLRYGLIVTVIAHFVFNLTLFGLFAAAGEALPYRITLAILVAIGLLPAVAVAAAWMRRRTLTDAPAEARFGAWQPVAAAPRSLGAVIVRRPLGTLARRAAMIAVAVGVVGVFASARRPVLGPPFTATRADAIAIADSVLRARGVDLGGWRRLAIAERQEGGREERFFERYDADSIARAIATTYRPAAGWAVRYVRIAGSVAERAEEWEVRLLPDGRVAEVEHTLPEEVAADSVSPDSARRLARAALERAGLDTAALREVTLRRTPRPRREDTVVEYVDSTLSLPGGATARARVTLAGSRPTGVARFVELPESFARDDRGDSENRAMISFAAGLLLMIATAAVAIMLLRRAPITGAGTALSPGARAVGLAAIAGVQLLGALNARPEALFGYETAQPWSTFTATLAITAALSAVVFALFTVGALNASSALRRRVGIPFWPDDDGRGAGAAARDALLTGAALALAPIALGVAAWAGVPNELPPAPETVLDARHPIIARALGVVQSALLGPALLSIPLVVLIVPRYRLLRALILVAAAALVASSGPASDVTTPGGVPGLALFALLALVGWGHVFRAWGTQSGASWFFAGLVAAAATCARVALAAAAPADRISATVGLAVAVTLIAGLYALSVRRAAPAPDATSPQLRP